MTERPKYHQSEIATFLKCGKLWEFRYLKKMVLPPQGAQVVGTSVDKSVNANMSEKAQTKRAAAKEKVLQTCSEAFDKAGENADWQDKRPGELKDAAIQVATLHYDHVAPQIQPVSVQESFIIETNAGYDLGGTIDLTDSQDYVRDTKVSSRQRSGSYAVPRSVQPAIYDFAFRAVKKREPRGFIYDILTKPTVKLSAEYKPVSGQVSSEDHHWLFENINQVHRAIIAGVALPAPEGSWYCSQEWCGFWHLCKGKKS